MCNVTLPKSCYVTKVKINVGGVNLKGAMSLYLKVAKSAMSLN